MRPRELRGNCDGRSFVWTAAIVCAIGFVGVASAATPDSTALAYSDLDGLGPSTAAPWNPPEPVERRRAWEKAMLLPGRIVSLPLSGLGRVTEHSLRYAEEHGFISMSENTVTPASNSGLSFQLPRLGGRAGVGGAVEARRRGPLATTWTARYAGTFRLYNGTQLAIRGRPLSLQYGFDWRPEEHFYGFGNETSRDELVNYARQSEYLRLTLGQPWRPGDRRMRGTGGGLFVETRTQVLRPGREPGLDSFEDTFPALGDALLDHRVEHLIYGAAFQSDRRVGQSHWDHGGRIQLLAERHDAPVQALALRVGEARGAQFNRYRIEGETGFPFLETRALRFLARVVDQDVTAGPERFLLSDLSSLGGREGLSGFPQDRFTDLDLALFKATYIFPIARRLELDLHSEWGGVYSDVWRDPTFGGLEHSFGFSVRGVYTAGAIASLGLDFSRESVRINYSVGGVE